MVNVDRVGDTRPDPLSHRQFSLIFTFLVKGISETTPVTNCHPRCYLRPPIPPWFPYKDETTMETSTCDLVGDRPGPFTVSFCVPVVVLETSRSRCGVIPVTVYYGT